MIVLDVSLRLEFLFDEHKLHAQPTQKLCDDLCKKMFRSCQRSVFTRLLMMFLLEILVSLDLLEEVVSILSFQSFV